MSSKSYLVLLALSALVFSCRLGKKIPPSPPLQAAHYYYQIGGTPESGVRQVLRLSWSDSSSAETQHYLLRDQDTLALSLERGSSYTYSGSLAVERRAIAQNEREQVWLHWRQYQGQWYFSDSLRVERQETEFLPAAPPRE